MTRHRWTAIVVVLALLGLAAFGFPCASSVFSPDHGSDRASVGTSASNGAQERSVSSSSRAAAESARSRVASPEAAQAAVARESKDALDEAEQARRSALREQILAAQRAREAAAKPDEAARPPMPAPEQPTSEGLTNHVDGHDELVDELNRNFLPLSDECIVEALERRPELEGGILEVGFQLVVDDELGSVIESVEIPEHGPVDDAQLHECMRESLLSMMLPAGEKPGSEALVLSLLVEP
jgi:hypothetical protein